MANFYYEGYNSQQKEVKGQIQANTREDALSKLKAQGMLPSLVREAKTGGKVAAAGAPAKTGFSLSLGISPKRLTEFTRQFSTLQDAGLPVVRSLRILEQQQKPGGLRSALKAVGDDVEGGASLSEAMNRQPKVFDRLYVSMVHAGEVAGALDVIFQRLAEFREKAQKLKRQIMAALIYPTAVVTIAVTILTLIIIFIVPQFETMFRDLADGEGLPAITEALLRISRAAVNHWYVIVFLPVLLVGGYHLVRMWPQGKLQSDRIKLRVPIFGSLIRKTAVARFSRTFGTLIASGVPILEALTILRDTTGNEAVAQAVQGVHDSVKEGEGVAQPMRASGIFNEMVINMVEVGETTGDLDKMLGKVADTYEDEVDTSVTALMSLLEPLLIVGMGLAVGFIVVALFMPLVSLMDKIQNAQG